MGESRYEYMLSTSAAVMLDAMWCKSSMTPIWK
jgi:hypothetical protein